MSYESIRKYSSPNYTPAAAVVRVFGVRRSISGITVHHWGDPKQSPRFSGVINWLCRKNGNTSAHAVIEAGKVAYIVNYSDASWHSGSKRGNATTIGLELNPRASDGDYDTAGEHIADIWLSYGRIPLYPHSYWKATSCPGKWDLRRLEAIAESWYRKKTGRPSGGVTAPKEHKWHTVRSGDTLWRIAHNNGLSVNELRKLNGIGSSNLIRIGSKLRVS